MTKRQRGSSPPNQEPEQGEFDWMKNPESNPPADQPVLPTFGEVKSVEENNGESRWQDDGGNGGKDG